MHLARPSYMAARTIAEVLPGSCKKQLVQLTHSILDLDRYGTSVWYLLEAEMPAHDRQDSSRSHLIQAECGTLSSFIWEVERCDGRRTCHYHMQKRGALDASLGPTGEGGLL